jgi:flagellar basal-body rod protein FlgG
MMRALYTAASGMTAQELNLDNIANNLSNSSTAGFRSRRLQFEDLIYQNLIMPGAAATQQTTVVAGLQVGLGTRSAASEVIQQQGDFSQTGNPLDMTIQGQGFFQVLLPDGQTAYTRAGSFHLDGQGNMVTQDGNPDHDSCGGDLGYSGFRRHGQRHAGGADRGAASGHAATGGVQ